MSEAFLNGKVTLLRGDCLELLPTLGENSIDSCVTDPPYHLTSVVKRFANADPEKEVYAQTSKSAYMSRGFMGQKWDGGDIAFRPELWAEVLRVLKPGAHLLAFSGTRTYHRMACAIEDAGFEIRDQLQWLYGAGFPKSHNVGKAIDKLLGVERTVKTGIKPGHENFVGRDNHPLNGGWDRPWASDPEAVDRYHSTFAPATPEAEQWEGWGSALKPAHEPIVLARKPLSESSVAANVLKHGTGAINIDGCRIECASTAEREGVKRPDSKDSWAEWSVKNGGQQTHHQLGKQRKGGQGNDLGRWPANLIHDGSEEVVRGFPDVGVTAGGKFSGAKGTRETVGKFGYDRVEREVYHDDGSAARFFYTAKADSDDRLGSKHPTVKPLDLIQYLIRLVTPKGGTILDPFAGTGTAGEAAYREGFKAVLCEREPEYQADIVRRMALCLAGPDERARESIKASGKAEDAGPLFGGTA